MDVNYKMGDSVLGTIVKEKDLGITISADMKVSAHRIVRRIYIRLNKNWHVT